MKKLLKLIVVIGYVLFLGMSAYYFFSNRSFNKNKIEAQGTAIELKSWNDGSVNPIIEYTYQGHNYKFTSDFRKEAGFYKQGNKYDIYINPNKPEQAQLQKQKYGYKKTWEERLAYPLIFIVATFIFFYTISEGFRKKSNLLGDIIGAFRI